MICSRCNQEIHVIKEGARHIDQYFSNGEISEHLGHCCRLEQKVEDEKK